MNDIVKYYCFECNDSCPICKKQIGLECYKNHGKKLYKYFLLKDILYQCSICTELCRPSDFICHYHGVEDICIWCRKSWNKLNETPDSLKHLIPCYFEFLKNALPPKIPSTDEHYFKEDIKLKSCPICKNSINKLDIMSFYICKHVFHTICISDWIIYYNIKKCPICFIDINFRQYFDLKKIGYHIEKKQMDVFLPKFFINVPTEYTNFYVNTIKEFYKQYPLQYGDYNLSVHYSLYPKWTLERFLRRFAYMLQYNSTISFGTDEFREKIKKHFKYIMFGLLKKQEIDTELLKINDTCAICLEKFNIGNKVKIILCKHFFHENCIEKCFQNSNVTKKCPVCRQNCNFLEKM